MAKHQNISGVSRRQLLRGATTAMAALGISSIATPRAFSAENLIIPTPTADITKYTAGTIPKGDVQNPGRNIGANDKITVAVIGVGAQGWAAHLKSLIKNAGNNNIQVIAACDVYAPRRERAKKEIGDAGVANPIIETDYRKILDNKDIDAVVVATPEHWHAQIAMHAMEAGKHVYCEKPMTRYADEAFQIVDTQKRTKKIFQLGIQFASDKKYHDVGDFIRSGKIGPLVAGQSSYCRNAGTKGEWNYDIDKGAGPDNLDWDLWLGSAPKRKWDDESKSRFFRYRKYWDYSSGILGDLMPHRMGPFIIASGNPEYPLRVASLGNRKVSLDREVDDYVQVVAEFPSGWTMSFSGSTVNEQGVPDLFRGLNASIYFTGDTATVKPELHYAEEMEETLISRESANYLELHHADWFNAIRTGAVNLCTAELGAKIQVILALAEMSSRNNRMMLFDEATRTIKPG
jgi:predicted dehydrogenase